jgi:hypothetical protein
MRLFYYIFFLSLTPLIIFSQKKNYYFDINSNRITQNEYKKINDNPVEYLKVKVVSDTAKIYTIEKRELMGSLNNDSYDELFLYLNSISEKKVDSSKTIIINYYPGFDKCNQTSGKDYVNNLQIFFLNQINSNGKVEYYFICKSFEGIEFYDQSIKRLMDKDRYIELTFFPNHYPCGSYLIVYPDKKYYIYKGEYYILDILHKI